MCSSGTFKTLVRKKNNVHYQCVACSCCKGSLVLQLCVSSCLELCFLCDTPITIKFDPCEHSVVCEQCARRASKCPHCKVSCLESKTLWNVSVEWFYVCILHTDSNSSHSKIEVTTLPRKFSTFFCICKLINFSSLFVQVYTAVPCILHDHCM